MNKIKLDIKDEDVIELICNQNIVCVFGGGSESGRRALGNRSITLNVSNFNSGLYYIKAQSKNKHITYPLLVK